MPPLTLNQMMSHRKLFAEILQNILTTGPKWESGKDLKHLKDRKNKKHLPQNTTLEQYNKIIIRILSNTQSKLTLHKDGHKYIVGNGKWITIINPSTIVETCFPPDNYKAYLSRKDYQYLGTLTEVIKIEE